MKKKGRELCDIGVNRQIGIELHEIQIKNPKQIEPEKQVPAESPTYMKLLLFRAVSEHKISQSRFVELLGPENLKSAEPCA